MAAKTKVTSEIEVDGNAAGRYGYTVSDVLRELLPFAHMGQSVRVSIGGTVVAEVKAG